MELDADLVEEFVLETRETIDVVEATLIQVERDRESGPTDPEVVNRLFRAFHSVKGTAGFLGMDRLVTVTHAGENLLDRVRGGELELGTPQVDALCDALDFCRDAVALMEAGKNDAGMDPDPVVVAIRAAQAAPTGSPEPAREPEAAASVPEQPVDLPAVEAEDDADEAIDDEPDSDPDEDEVPDPAADEEVPVAQAAAAPTRASRPAAQASPSSSNRAGEDSRQKSIRVDVDKLESLLNMVGELILAETSVTHHERAAELLEEDTFRRAVLQLNRVTRSLQDIAMSLRMVPVEATFNRLQRLVRDLARKQGKQVELELTGLDTEVDKNLIEAINDPLVHILRNSIDHGLETPEERKAAGKDPNGTVHVDARHQAGEVWITVEDDGRGMNPERILDAAIRKGLVPPDVQLSQQEILALVFEPGFSTAEKITDVSGRGVGMDVVRRNIQALNGRIEIESELGTGTRVRLRVPLTLAIIEGMLVRVGSMRYTLPLLAIRESVPVANGGVRTLPNGRRIARIRGEILPVYTLNSLTGEPRESEGEGILIALEHGGRTFVVEVDELQGQRQTVVKGLPGYLSRQRGLAGCSILPNGEITLILDLADIAGWAAGQPEGV
ncbi:MAG: chemotaxis protein CheA [Alphaproteobacteria bacterium]|nr:chemotaxis protein CheA [Alphaproteobacteria bacterium]